MAVILIPIFVVQSLSHFQLCVTPWTSDAARLFCPPWSPWICSNLCPLNWWCYMTISSSAAHFSFCLIYVPVFSQWKIINEKVQLQQPKLPMNIQGWFPLGLTSLISLQFKGLSSVFSSTSISKHQFFSTWSSLWSNSDIYRWILETPELWHYGPLSAKWCLCFLIFCLPRGKCLLILWLQSPSAVILKPKKITVTASTFYPSICHEIMGVNGRILSFF